MTDRPAEALWCVGCDTYKVVGEMIDDVLCCEFCGDPLSTLGEVIDAIHERFKDR